ncbi:hypothetical protein SUGI_0645550 [Cryptomeria japonica]|nr:hypothetical protein SUGI_0645550 [Cryptomeria japonica]
MNVLKGSAVTCFLALLFALTFVVIFKRWSEELWKENSIAASNLYRPEFNPNNNKESATVWQQITKAKQSIDCSCKAAQISSLLPKFTFPNNKIQSPGNNSESCPFYFKFIRQDLKPWEKGGITLEAVEKAKSKASFRVIVINGRLFVESYHHCFQTRDLFTIWGFAQMLKKYPGMVPDFDLMFNCNDKPVIRKDDYKNAQPPPLFHYCGSSYTYDIAFPDWSFWGWVELQIPPWDRLVQEIRNGSQRIKWENRDPTAYWKGNPWVSPKRVDLMKCKKSPNWNGKLYTQDWVKESKEGFRNSKLSTQCVHRYKIYVEGNAWSVSLKYILACNSPTLLITPEFHDFFNRGLIPQHHYWPIKPNKKCESIKFIVNWGNNNTKVVKEIGKAGSDFMLNELKMKEIIYARVTG